MNQVEAIEENTICTAVRIDTKRQGHSRVNVCKGNMFLMSKLSLQFRDLAYYLPFPVTFCEHISFKDKSPHSPFERNNATKKKRWGSNWAV